ncbi:MAG: hypothetical protein ABIP63_10385 [Thermoanaerobaculia bacterium]
MVKRVSTLMAVAAASLVAMATRAASGSTAPPALVQVGQTALAVPNFTDAAAMMQRTTVVLSLLAIWMLVAICLTLVNGREIRLSSLEIRSSPLHCFALGLVAVTSLVLTAIVCTYLIPYLIGFPLLFALALLAVVTKIYGTIAVFHAVGSFLTAPRSRNALAGRRWLRGDLAMVIVGGLVLGGLRIVPVVGPVIWACASVFGVGVALGTRFGRREPWFLAWRPVET